MPILPIRGVAAKGILRDPSPYELDLDAWSAGSNVRFHANKAERAPIWRTVYDAFPEEPTFAVGLEPSTGHDTVMVQGADGRLWQYGSGAISEVSQGSLNAPVIDVAGSGYAAGSPPAVTFSAPSLPGGTTATGTAVVSGGGAVTGITITNVPHGYATPPTITIAAPGAGVTATAHCTLAFTPVTDPRATTGCFLGDVLYINRPDEAPRYFGPASTVFANLPNMDSAWTCRSLRAFGDYLIALNVTKPATWVDPHTGATEPGGALPNLFKWSNLTLDGQVPDSWDPFDPTKSTGENPLEELTSPIVDGLTLKSVFVIYSEDQIWAAQQVDTNNIFYFSKMFSEGGMIAPNCGVEVDGIHYVFGPQDIYRHDGVQKQSIVDKRNKNFIYRTLNKAKSEVFFAAYMPQYDSILFAYNTGDNVAKFTNCDRCNYGAVYDIKGDTWSFVDLPNISSLTQANLDTVLTYATCPATLTYANVGGTYYDQDNTFVKNVVGVSGAVSGLFANSRIVAYDFMNKGSLAFRYEPEMNAPAFLERTGLALDQVGSDLTTYKLVRRIFPLVEIFDNVPVTITVGGSQTPSGSPTYAAPVTFNPATQYKVDVMKGGRYLALNFTVSQAADFEVAGYDLDVADNGRR